MNRSTQRDGGENTWALQVWVCVEETQGAGRLKSHEADLERWLGQADDPARATQPLPAAVSSKMGLMIPRNVVRKIEWCILMLIKIDY